MELWEANSSASKYRKTSNSSQFLTEFGDETGMLTETGPSGRDRTTLWAGLKNMRIPWDLVANNLAQVVGKGEG